MTGCASDHATHYVPDFKKKMISEGPNVSVKIVAGAMVIDDCAVDTDSSVEAASDEHDTNGTVSLKITVNESCKTCALLIG